MIPGRNTIPVRLYDTQNRHKEINKHKENLTEQKELPMSYLSQEFWWK